jgi:hypothetical protein
VLQVDTKAALLLHTDEEYNKGKFSSSTQGNPKSKTEQLSNSEVVVQKLYVCIQKTAV